MPEAFQREQHQLYAERQGEGPVVVLLHGLFGQSGNLGGVARALQDRYTVISMDLRNHGRSPHQQGMSIAELANDVRHRLDRFDVEKASILGHSLGGKVAMQFAFTWQERVDRLLVADIAPVAYPPHHQDILRGLRNVDVRGIKGRTQADQAMAADVPEKMVRQFLLTNLVRDEQGGWQWKLNLDAIEAGYQQIRGAPEEGLFEGPTLFIKGEVSDYIQRQHQPQILRQFPKAETVTINGAGHWLHAEKPAAFNAAVSEFLDRGMGA